MATIVEGNPKAPFSIATTPMCRGGRYSFPETKKNTILLVVELLAITWVPYILRQTTQLIICLHAVKWLSVSYLCNNDRLTSVIYLHTFKWIYIYDLLVNRLLVISFLNELHLIFLHTSVAVVFSLLNGY